MALPDGLLNAVKNYNDITWDMETEEEEKLTGIISRGMNTLDDLAGVSLDYTEEGAPREMLMEYVRYTRENRLHMFFTEHLTRIVSLQVTQT
jgi:hypothetical protein